MGAGASRRRAALALVVSALVALAVFAPVPPRFGVRLGLPGVVSAQGDPLASLNEEYERLESEGLKENYIRLLSYTMLQEYLPPGTRFTSGYRSPQKQLDLIVRMARARGVQVPAQASVEDEGSWRPALNALRSQGVIIAAPTATPHATDEAVFDLSGADLNDIRAGLESAQRAGMVKFRRILFEPRNNAVHVEIESLSPKALNALGKRRGAAGPVSAPGAESSPAPASEAEQRRGMLQQLQALHDSEPDPAKKIDYDRSKRNLLDPSADAEEVRALDEEIRQHQRQAAELGSQTQRRAAFERVSEALREDRLDDAQSAAEQLLAKYPNLAEAKNMLARVRTRRLIQGVTDALYTTEEPACGDCERAAAMLDEALRLSPNYEGAEFFREDVNACLARCRGRRLPYMIAGLLLFGGLIAGLFYVVLTGKFDSLVRSSKSPAPQAQTGWVLEGVGGACRGQVFPLDKPEVLVGSKGPPEGAADIVICDAERKISRRHCLVVHNGERFYVTDESTNGTKINGREIPGRVPSEFRQGDRISLADAAVLVLRPK